VFEASQFIFLANFDRTVNSSRCRPVWVDSVQRLVETRNIFKILAGKIQMRESLEGTACEWILVTVL
jgi:hypothetical protein